MKKLTNRTLNPTNRVRIKREHVTISLEKVDGKILNCNCKLNLKDYHFPSDSNVYIDAYRGYEYDRYPLDKISQLKPEYSFNITQFINKEILLYSLKVVSDSDNDEIKGKIIGICKGLKPDNDENYKSLLPVIFRPIEDNRIWILDYDDIGGPILIFNDKIPGIRIKSRNDDLYFFSIYPYVFESILYKILIIDEFKIESLEVGNDEFDEDWHTKWLYFAEKLNPMNDPLIKIEDKIEWISNCISYFANQYSKRWEGIILSEDDYES
jgi:hypothetical protein